jgi:hypothetical protein
MRVPTIAGTDRADLIAGIVELLSGWMSLMTVRTFNVLRGTAPPSPARESRAGPGCTLRCVARLVEASKTLAMESVRLDGYTRTLQLLVLWRGSPGWLYKGGSTRGGGSESPTMSSERGDVKVEISMNAATRQILVQGTPHQLGSANVILVDHVDAPEGAGGSQFGRPGARAQDVEGTSRIRAVRREDAGRVDAASFVTTNV